MANEISLEWVDDLRFEGRAGSSIVAIDGNGDLGTSPVDLLLQSIGSCAGADVADILKKGRQDLQGMTIEVSADRRVDHPRSVKRLVMKFKIRGPVDEAKARRAVDLSLEKYCSVFHSLRMDVALDVDVVVAP
ncbi:MAG: OsmC family protein [Gemmatimonadota bacterium]|nr:OsmC family protein [Gemmatimonadota bacterium]